MEPTLKKGDACYLNSEPATVTRCSKSRDGKPRILVTRDAGGKGKTFEWGGWHWSAIGVYCGYRPRVETPAEHRANEFRSRLHRLFGPHNARSALSISHTSPAADWDALIATLGELRTEAVELRLELFGSLLDLDSQV